MRDRAEVLHQLIMSQPDAVVADRQGTCILVRLQRDLQRRVVPILLLGQLNVPHLVEGIGGVRDQLAQRDLAILIERVRQDMQELLDLGLKRELLLYVGHGGLRHAGDQE